MSEENQSNLDQKEIDFLQIIKKMIQLFKKLREKKLFIFIWIVVGLLGGIIVVLSIPKEYTSELRLLPESPPISSEFAALQGSGFGNGTSRGEVISANLYPDIVYSTPFLVQLMPLEMERGGETESLYEYLRDHQRKAWWQRLKSLPYNIAAEIKGFFADHDAVSEEIALNVEALTPSQYAVFNKLKSRISVSIDKRTSVVLIQVKMQDPYVALTVAKAIMDKLQVFISDYSSQKIRKDLDYIIASSLQAKQDYVAAQKELAAFLDENESVRSLKMETEKQRLQNELDIAYNAHSRMLIVLEEKKMEVEEQMLSYIVISPATQPTVSSKPSKFRIIGVCILLVTLGSVSYRIWKDKMYRIFLEN